MMRGLGVVVLLALLGAAAPRTAAEVSHRPNFSGTWRLDVAHSQLGKLPGQPRARTDVIEHREPEIRQTLFLDNVSRMDTTVYRYTTDGKPTVNRVDGKDIRSTVWWEGNRLRLESKTKLLVIDVSLKERWNLSADGKKLTMTRRVESQLMKGDQILVFERQ